MRFPGPGLIVAILAAVAASSGALSVWGGGGGHVPRTDAEIAAATHAETYARTLEGRGADLACRLASGAAASGIGCGTAHRRAPPPCGSGKITVGDSSDSRAEVNIVGCSRRWSQPDRAGRSSPTSTTERYRARRPKRSRRRW